MYLTIRGLVLRVTAYNDADALLVVLTRTHGKLTVKARGLRRKSSPLSAPCQLLAYNEFTLFEYRGMYTINEASTVELFSPLRRDIQKLSLATYMGQVAETLSQEDMPNPELLSLVLNGLYALSKLNMNETQIKAAFELRCACLAGYMPDLQSCNHCSNAYPDKFDITNGQLECSGCRIPGAEGIRMPINASVLEAMRYICNCNPKQVFSFRLGEESLNILSQLTEGYLSTQLERGFSTLDFYKSLFISL